MGQRAPASQSVKSKIVKKVKKGKLKMRWDNVPQLPKVKNQKLCNKEKRRLS